RRIIHKLFGQIASRNPRFFSCCGQGSFENKFFFLREKSNPYNRNRTVLYLNTRKTSTALNNDFRQNLDVYSRENNRHSGFYCNIHVYAIHFSPLSLPSLMQQPLAMGYYISTAPTGPMPAWFWSACRQTSQSNPVCLKSALHLHLSLVGNDDAVTTDTAVSSGVAGSADGGRGYAGHLLDSTVTCDVLRFVLESYNSLSWLTYDPVTNDRRSCLPFHILALAQLSQATRIFT
ncbi:unnamed protein product, partial [Schistocephalus solidus]|uniref:Mediator of RNA polymerase II transcription subunit 13 n=1 Tax=Schistocephalus solidus TaxID=70667 RepID=A0A183SPJ4_SCHSO